MSMFNAFPEEIERLNGLIIEPSSCRITTENGASLPTLGIFRMYSETEMLDLISFWQHTDIITPRAFQSVVISVLT